MDKKQTLIFATGNPNKVKEVAHLLDGIMEVGSLQDIGCITDLSETHETLEENALEKAQYVVKHHGVNCFSEDTGLEVEALDGAPGVYSARYAGPQKKDTDNIALLLKNLEGEKNRKARFRTVIALLLNGEEHLFEGIVTGVIAKEPSGTDGFGYDPVFIPDGYDITFAQMSLKEKAAISHRKRAVDKLVGFLADLGKKY